MIIMKCAELKSTYFSALIYARPGMGKTTLLGALPGKVLIIDVDRGTTVLSGSDTKADCVRLKEDLSDLSAIIDELSKECPYDIVALDSLSELEKNMLTVLGRLGKNNGAPERGHYNIVQHKVADYVRRIRALPCNCVFTAWEEPKEVANEDGSTFTIARPSLSGKTSDIVCGLVDMVGQLRITPPKDGSEVGTRFVDFRSATNAVRKDRIFHRDFCMGPDLFEKPKAKSADKKATKEGK